MTTEPSSQSSAAVQVRRPRAIVFDILGTASKSGFLEKILFPFLKVNLDSYITTHWTKKDFLKLYRRIMELSVEFNKREPTTPVVVDHDSGSAKTSLLEFINFVTENGINAPAVTELRFRVWFEGYQQSKLRTPIYSDVPNRMRKWFAEGIKFYVFSNTWLEAQKALLRNTNHGDLTQLISGHYDNEFGSLLEPESWRRLCADLKEQPNDVLFLTKSPPEARAAAEVGVNVVLVLTHRHNVKAISHEDRQRFPVLRTFNDLVWLEGSMMPGNETPSSSSPVGPVALSGIQARTARSVSNTNQALSASQAPNPPLVSSHSSATAIASANPSRATVAPSQASTSNRAASSRATANPSAHSTSTTASASGARSSSRNSYSASKK